MPVACYLSDDLSIVRLLGETINTDQTMPIESARTAARAMRQEGTEPGADNVEVSQPQDAIWWRDRALAVAGWISERAPADKRIAAICLGISDVSCVWLSAPSAQRRVISAALRQGESEWADLEAGGLIEPLVAPGGPSASRLWEFSAFGLGSKRTKSPARALRMPVILGPDALPRLLLDALDDRGIRVGAVLSLWHAAAAAWVTPEDSGSLSAVVLAEPNQLTWSWARGALLVAGGRLDPAPRAHAEAAPGAAGAPGTAGPAPADVSACRARLSLDWLAWATNLGDVPRLLTIVGSNAEALVVALRDALPGATVRAIPERDPIGATVRAAAHAATLRPASRAGEDARLELATLSRRPGRAHRRLHTWTGAALAALAVGVGALGWRMRDQRAAALSAAAERKADQAALLKEVAPDLAGHPNPLRALESRLAEIQKKSPDVKDPTPARPILDELGRLAGVLAEMGPKGVKIDDIQMHDIAPVARITAPDFATGEEFSAKLRAAAGGLRWRVDFEGDAGGGNLRYRLSGEWPREGA